MKLTKLNKEEEKEDTNERIYFGRTKTELLKRYEYVFNINELFGQDVLKVRLNNDNLAYVDKNFNILCEYQYIYGMDKLFHKEVLSVQLKNNNIAYLDKNYKVICEFDKIKKVGDYYIITLKGKRYILEK